MNIFLISIIVCGRDLLSYINYSPPELQKKFSHGKTSLYLYMYYGGATNSNSYHLYDEELVGGFNSKIPIFSSGKCDQPPRVEFDTDRKYRILSSCRDFDFHTPIGYKVEISIINNWSQIRGYN
jgi:hypothetical protein